MIELQIEMVQRDQDHDIQEDDDLMEEVQDSTTQDDQNSICHQKVKPVVDHIRAKSCGLIFYPMHFSCIG